MGYKVLLDTNVLISWSLYRVPSDEDILPLIKHDFFDQCMRLIGLIKKHINKRIGIITRTIEDEAFSSLSKAIQQELEKAIQQELENGNTDRSTLFQEISIIENSCETRLKNILSWLVCEPIDPEESEKLRGKVDEMYTELTKMARDHPKTASQKTDLVPKGFRALAFDIYVYQDQLLIGQMNNLLTKPIEETDIKILAEAAYLNRLYKATMPAPVKFMLASTDRHFSPYRKEGLESNKVTLEIEKRFGIVCDWPHQVAQELQKTLK